MLSVTWAFGRSMDMQIPPPVIPSGSEGICFFLLFTAK
jgi:hypothetical protein